GGTGPGASECVLPDGELTVSGDRIDFEPTTAVEQILESVAAAAAETTDDTSQSSDNSQTIPTTDGVEAQAAEVIPVVGSGVNQSSESSAPSASPDEGSPGGSMAQQLVDTLNAANGPPTRNLTDDNVSGEEGPMESL